MRYIPNPGGKAAIEKGCLCPVIGNNHGEGVMLEGRQTFWISEACPLHNYAALTSQNPTDTLPAREQCD